MESPTSHEPTKLRLVRTLMAMSLMSQHTLQLPPPPRRQRHQTRIDERQTSARPARASADHNKAVKFPLKLCQQVRLASAFSVRRRRLASRLIRSPSQNGSVTVRSLLVRVGGAGLGGFVWVSARPMLISRNLGHTMWKFLYSDVYTSIPPQRRWW